MTKDPARGRPVFSRGPIIRSLELVSAVWLVVIAAVIIAALVTYNDTLTRIKNNRSQAVHLTCALLSGVSAAGHDLIVTVPKDTPFYRWLERHGYPSRTERIAAAQKSANAYVASLVRDVNGVPGFAGASVVERNGTVDCREVARLVGTNPNPRSR